MLKYKIPQIVTLTQLFSYIDLLNYMLKYKIPQIVTLTQDFKKRKLTDKKNGLTITCKTTFE